MRYFRRKKYDLAAFAKIDPWWKTEQWGRTYIATELVVAIIIFAIASNGITGAIVYYTAPAKIIKVKEVVVEKPRECVNVAPNKEVDVMPETVPPIKQ